MAGCRSLTTPFEHKFNPAAPNTAVEDDGRWDAFEPSMSMAQNEMLSVVWCDKQATSVLEQSGVEFPYNDLFDPAVLPSQFDISFNPAVPRYVLTPLLTLLQ